MWELGSQHKIKTPMQRTTADDNNSGRRRMTKNILLSLTHLRLLLIPFKSDVKFQHTYNTYIKFLML